MITFLKDDVTTFYFDFERPSLSPKANTKHSGQSFVAMNMMNKCAKSNKNSSTDKKVKFNVPSAIELLEMAEFVYNFDSQRGESVAPRIKCVGLPRHGWSKKICTHRSP